MGKFLVPIVLFIDSQGAASLTKNASWSLRCSLFSEYKKFESNEIYLKSIDRICNVEFSSIDCFVKSLGLRIFFV